MAAEPVVAGLHEDRRGRGCGRPRQVDSARAARKPARAGDFPYGRPAGPPNLPLAITTAIGRQAAAEAGKAARNLLNRFQPRRPEDRE